MKNSIKLKIVSSFILFFCIFASSSFSLTLSSHETIAKRIEKENELFKFGYQENGIIGDYKLSNNYVSFIIEGKRYSSYYSPYGGGIIDGANKKSIDLIQEIFPVFLDERGILNIRTADVEDIKIISAGGKNKSAILRVKGKDANIPIIDETLKKSSPIGLEITTDYILEPNTRYLTIKSFIKNTSDSKKTITTGLGFFIGDWMRFFAYPFGFKKFLFKKNIFGAEVEYSKRAYNLFGGVSLEGVSYGFFSPDGEVGETYKNDSFYLAFYNNRLLLDVGEEKVWTYYLAVGDGDIESIKDCLPVVRKAKSIKGKVKDTKRKNIKDARIYITDENNNFKTYVLSDKYGNFSAKLEEGNYKFFIFSDGRSPKEIRAKVEGESELNITLPQESAFEVEITDQDKLKIPAVLCFKKEDEYNEKLYSDYDEKGKSNVFFKVYFATEGKEKIKIEPGKYTIWSHRGFEYEIWNTEVEIKEGETKKLKIVLQKVINPEGYISGDFHLHTVPSPDSDVIYKDRIKSLIASGIFVAASTDHDYITDYSPYVKKIKQEKNLMSIASEELTTKNYGHFNPFPMILNKNLGNNGALRWFELTPKEIFKKLRDEHPDVLIQVNHPRSSGSYFNVVGYDPKTGKVQKEDIWDDTFDLIEVFNGKRTAQLLTTLPDWFSFLNQGKKYAAVGNSDCHNPFNLSVGYPRNYIFVGKNKPSQKEVINALKKQKVVVCGGPWIDFKINGRGIGEMVSKEDKILLSINVQSPRWMPLTKIKIIANGKEIKTIPVVDTKEIIKFNNTVIDEPKKDTWYIVVAEGEIDLYPVYPDAVPYSFTNPIYVDVDGNGRFDPPGLDM